MPYAKMLALTHPDVLSDKEWNRLCKGLNRANAKGYQFLKTGIASCRLKFLEDEYGYHVYQDQDGGSTIKWNLLFKKKDGMRVLEEGCMSFRVLSDTNEWKAVNFENIKKGDTFRAWDGFDNGMYEDDDGVSEFVAESDTVNRTVLCYPKPKPLNSTGEEL